MVLRIPAANDGYGLVSGELSTVLQAAGICASVIPWLGFGEFFGGVGWMIKSLNQKARSSLPQPSPPACGVLRALAIIVAGRACHADVKVIVVAIPRSDLTEPAAVAGGVAAKRLLDRGVDKDALDARFLGGGAQHHEMAGRKNFRVDVEAIVTHHHDGGHFFAIFAGRHVIGHRRQPDIRV